MTKQDKKKKYIRLLNQLSKARKEAGTKRLADHDFYIDGLKKGVCLFDHLLFRAILEQAEGLSLTFNKPHSYQPEEAEKVRLGKEALETLEKAAILRPTRLGPLTLIG